MRRHGPVGLELFSGCGEFSRRFRAQAREHGLAIFEWDIRWSATHDLMRPSVRRQLLGWIGSGLIACVWLGTPCTSFSRAQQFWRGAFPLRTSSQPAGCPWVKDMPPHTQELVRTDNALATLSVAVFRQCCRLEVPVALENPGSSLLWQMPQMLALNRREDVTIVETDYCMFGVPWRKRTKFMYAYVDLSCIARKCSSRKGVCDRTGHRHVQLQGTASCGKLLTKLAEPYPAKLCKLLASSFSAALCSGVVRRLRKLANGCSEV